MAKTPPLPDWLEPMAATLTGERFSGQDWVFERKFDGIRLLAYKDGARVELFSRNHLPQDMPEVASAVASVPAAQVILDGEVAWDGRSSYHVFDNRLLLDLRRRLDAIELPASPFTVATGLPKIRTHWVQPKIVVQVAFTEWTRHGKLRHPRLLGVRFDQKAREVTREQW